jgi:hypothetical protein
MDIDNEISDNVSIDNNFSGQGIKDLIFRINKLNNKEKLHILNILKTNNIDFSQNSNGYFFNMIKVDDAILEKICKCLNLIEENRDLIKEMDKRRDELLIYYKTIINQKLQESLSFRKNQYMEKLFLKNFKTNIVSDIKRVYKINSVDFLKNGTLDPEIVMKEYFKAKRNYKKDTVHHRLSSRIKAIKSNKFIETKKQDNDNFDDDEDNKIENNIEIESFGEKEEGEEEEELSDKVTEDEIINELEDEINDDESYTMTDVDEDGITDDQNTDGDEITDGITDGITERDKITENGRKRRKLKKHLEDDKTDNDMIFYKNLLNKQGFTFDNDKGCFILYQEYIN